MARLANKMSKKAGLPPGTLVHVGLKTDEAVSITVMDYSEDEFQEKRVERVEECFPFKDKPTVTWINVDGVHQVDIIEKIGNEMFGITVERQVHSDRLVLFDADGKCQGAFRSTNVNQFAELVEKLEQIVAAAEQASSPATE